MNCGTLRKLKTMLVERAGAARQADLCKPCTQAAKEAMRRENA